MAASRLRVWQDDNLRMVYIASVATTIRVLVRGHYDNGKPFFKAIEEPTAVATRTTTVLIQQPDTFQHDGWVESLSVTVQTTACKRGQCYILIQAIGAGGATTLASGYAYDGHVVTLGDAVEPGPGGGEGFRSAESAIIQQAVIGDTSTVFQLAATNARRRIHGLWLYYNAAAVVATRTINLKLRGMKGSIPAGFTAGANEDEWVSATLTLTTGEEGHIFVNAHGAAFVAVNDNGTVTLSNHTTAPNPLPIDIMEEDEEAEFEVTVSSGDTGDRYDVGADVEEWLVL